MRLTLAGVLAVGLAACGGGGGGGDSSDDSRDLRAAIDRLHAGMTYEESVAAVGWPPNENRNVWVHDGLQLQLGFRTPPNGKVPLIEQARLTGRGEAVDRVYQ
jgi:hypothetical protein